MKVCPCFRVGITIDLLKVVTVSFGGGEIPMGLAEGKGRLS